MSSPPRPLPALSRLFPGVFYGWLIAIGTGLLSFASVGIGFYSLTVFLDGLCAEHGWSRSSVSGASGLYIVVSGVAGTFVGRSIDRRGGRGWIVAGVCLMAAALLAIGWLEQAWQLFPVYAAMGTGFAMCGGIPSNSIIARWFIALRARAMSVSQTGVSVGGVLIVPLATALIQSGGVELATRVLAGLLVAVAIPVTLLVLRWDPLDHGLAPDGATARPSANPLLGDDYQRLSWSRREALGTWTFWLLALAFGAVLFCQTALLIHELAFLGERMGRTTASLAVSATAGGSIVGRLAIGSFADRTNLRRLSAALFLVQAIALSAFAFASGTAALYAVAFLFGCTIGNVYMMQSLLLSELFGITSFGTVFGALSLVTQIASGLGPLALGLLFDASGSYEGGLLILGVVVVVAAGVVAAIRPPRLPAAVEAAG